MVLAPGGEDILGQIHSRGSDEKRRKNIAVRINIRLPLDIRPTHGLRKREPQRENPGQVAHKMIPVGLHKRGSNQTREFPVNQIIDTGQYLPIKT